MEKIYDSGMQIPDFITALFEKEIVTAIGVQMKTPDDTSVAFTLITDARDAGRCVPFYPVMPVNAAKAASRLTREAPPSKTVALILRPCEQRALVELTKIRQARLDHILVISFDCGGVLPIQGGIYPDGDRISDYYQHLKTADNNPHIRPVCSGCEQIVPTGADIAISLIGRGVDKPLALRFCTEKGEDVRRKIGLSSAPEIKAVSGLEKLRDDKKKAGEKLAGSIEASLADINGLVNLFDACIACHACRYVCPVCYCRNCFFESSTFQYYPENYVLRLSKKNTLRLPLDRILFHLGRLSHMSAACVACGMCSDVCPVHIPVAEIFKTAGASVQQLFDYHPGQNPEEPPPLLTYREKELHKMEN